MSRQSNKGPIKHYVTLRCWDGLFDLQSNKQIRSTGRGNYVR